MRYEAAIITLSDKGYKGEREDKSGEAIANMLAENGWQVSYRSLLPDDYEMIRAELIKCSDELEIPLVLTTGGTGFSKRDITPEATLSVCEREVRGIPEAMRLESLKITPMGMLSRAASGIRKNTLIINLPGSEKAVRECLGAIIKPIKHGVDILIGEASECAQTLNQTEDMTRGCFVTEGKVLAVCISEKKGEQKHQVESIFLKKDHGIVGDAHAGNWHRQVSLLGKESVDKLRGRLGPALIDLPPGAFAENILTEGILLYQIPIGARLRVGEAVCEVTQIGKECHNSCEIRKICGDCVMPREGIFVKVIEEGFVRAGDKIEIL